MTKATFSVVGFCHEHGISRGLFYRLLREGQGPATMSVGRRTLISHEAAEKWRRRMETAGAGEAKLQRKATAVSSKPLSSAFEPDATTKASRRNEIARRLRQRGQRGLTRMEAPRHLVLSMPARICELRKAGYKIATQRERHGGSLIARYVLLEEPNAKDLPEAGDGGD